METPVWRKSSRSNSGGCVEAASCRCPQDPDWRKSRHSNSGTGNCLEAGNGPSSVLVRDTADRSGPVLTFGPGAWKVFTGTLKDGAL